MIEGVNMERTESWDSRKQQIGKRFLHCYKINNFAVHNFYPIHNTLLSAIEQHVEKKP